MKRLAIFVATSGHSGVDRNMKNLIPEIAAHNIQVDVLRIRNHGLYLEQEVSKLPDNVRIVELNAAHVNTSLLPLLRYLVKERPHAMLTDKDKVNRLALWARWLAHVPTRLAIRIGTTVSKNLENRSAVQRWAQYTSIRLFYHWADAIITPSRGAAEDLAQIARLPVERISVIPSPVITKRFCKLMAQPVEHPWFTHKDRPVVLGVGELSKRKDFATLLRAFARLRKQRPARLIILGEGRQRIPLEQLATELGIRDDLHLAGFTPNPYAFMARADLFVLSSTCEGAPVALIEALGVGVPAISTDCPSGPAEILDGGRVGPLVPVGDHTALAEAMRQMLDEPPNPSRLQAAVRPYRSEVSAVRYLQALGLEPLER
ncbi:MAG TPA: glycosyltransferase [Gammaproteobacteria bacterium]|nr:glycosyltransferase [Gammaproteobacteria bacterium]